MKARWASILWLAGCSTTRDVVTPATAESERPIAEPHALEPNALEPHTLEPHTLEPHTPAAWHDLDSNDLDWNDLAARAALVAPSGLDAEVRLEGASLTIELWTVTSDARTASECVSRSSHPADGSLFYFHGAVRRVTGHLTGAATLASESTVRLDEPLRCDPADGLHVLAKGAIERVTESAARSRGGE